jgi:hypothetical protein
MSRALELGRLALIVVAVIGLVVSVGWLVYVDVEAQLHPRSIPYH